MRIRESITKSIANLLGLNAEQPLKAIFCILLGLITFAWFGDVIEGLINQEIENYLSFQFIFRLSAFPVLAIAFLLNYSYQTQKQQKKLEEKQKEGFKTTEPSLHKGLILFLSPYTPIRSKYQKDEEQWNFENLRVELDKSRPDYDAITYHVDRSNLQVPVEAIKWHAQNKILRHCWLITTRNVKRDCKIISPGSHPLAKYLCKYIREGLGFNFINFYFDEQEYKVYPYDLIGTFNAIDRIFKEELSRKGLNTEEVISDFTSGRVPMSGGMLLACLPYDRHIEYTTIDVDPAGNYVDKPKPVEVKVDSTLLRELVLGDFLRRVEITVDET